MLNERARRVWLCDLTQEKTEMALKGIDVQIVVGPMLCCTFNWQKHMQTYGKRQTDKECHVRGWLLRFTCVHMQSHRFN